MKVFLLAVLASLCISVAAARQSAVTDKNAPQVNSQSSSQAAAQASANGQNAGADLAEGTTVHAVLTKPVDARKSKVGDEVAAKSTEDVKSQGRAVIPKGSRLLGHVTEARAKTKGESDSALGIAFDRAVLKDGRELPFSFSIQALAASRSTATAAADPEPTMGSTGPAMGPAGRPNGGMLGGATGTVGATAGAAANTAGSVGTAAGGAIRGATEGMTAEGTLTSSAQGVIGLPGMTLDAGTSAGTQGSVITSKNQNVHLDSGTQLVLRANAK
jgi:hypothetical protein